MRPTTANDGNLFDFNSLLHPGTVFEHPMDVVAAPRLTISEKRAILASVRRVGDRVMSGAAGARRAESACDIDEILDVLCTLDGGPRNPPGGKPMRLRSTERRAAA